MRPLVVLALIACAACGQKDASPSAPPAPTPPSACAPGTLVQDDGSCRAAGVLACASGFVSDGEGGCAPVLPAEACAFGTMAVPGETTCREVAPCGSDAYGDAPEEATTQHVDAAYAAGGSDGTRGKPWTTIAQGIAAAQVGAVVAVAEGKYPDTLRVDKRVRVWGRCPAKVELGVIGMLATGAEVHSLATTGSILAHAGKTALVDRVWFHDSTAFAFGVDAGVEATVRDCLVERAAGTGVSALGGILHVERTVVRDIKLDSTNIRGEGMRVDVNDKGLPSTLSVTGSLVERTIGFGIVVVASTATIEATAVRDVRENTGDRQLGRGVNVQGDPTVAGRRGNLTMRGVVIERAVESGLTVAGSDAVVEDTSVRDTRSRVTDGYFGVGVYVSPGDTTKDPATLVLRGSQLARNRWAGVHVAASTATIESCILADTQPATELGLASGVVVAEMDGVDLGAKATLRASAIRAAQLTGVMIVGGAVDVERTSIVGTQAGADGSFGDGITVLSLAKQGTASLVDSRVEGSARGGLAVFGSSASIRGTELECNAIALATEEDEGRKGTLADLGGNSCGCGAQRSQCLALSSKLTPPTRPPAK